MEGGQIHLPFRCAVTVYGAAGQNRPEENGADYRQTLAGAACLERKGLSMVKGTTRQVILVKSPDPKLFEEAIFIVKEEALSREGVDADQVIRQARQAADGYLKGSRMWNRGLRGAPRLEGPLWGAGGAALASLLWGAWLMLF